MCAIHGLYFIHTLTQLWFVLCMLLVQTMALLCTLVLPTSGFNTAVPSSKLSCGLSCMAVGQQAGLWASTYSSWAHESFWQSPLKYKHLNNMKRIPGQLIDVLLRDVALYLWQHHYYNKLYIVHGSVGLIKGLGWLGWGTNIFPKCSSNIALPEGKNWL